jgi:Arc/MetJ family transcription regulator
LIQKPSADISSFDAQVLPQIAEEWDLRLHLKCSNLHVMKVRVEIDEKTLAEVIALTGETRKSSAPASAIREFVNRHKAKEFGRLIRQSAFDYPDADNKPMIK